MAQAAEPTIALDPAYDGPIVETAATRAALAKMATREDEYTQTLTVTTHLVITKVAGDEEYRAVYGAAQWDNEAEARLEAADNQPYTYWGLNIVATDFINWDSNDSTNACGTLLGELQSEVPHGSFDLVVGYTNQPTGIGGCSEVNGDAFLVDYQSSSADWKVTQHEFSHNLGAEDASGAAHPDDVMENPYNTPNVWCTVAGWNHWGVIDAHKTKFD